MNLTIITAFVIGFMGIKVYAFDSMNAFEQASQKDRKYEAQYQVMREEIKSLKEALQNLGEQLDDLHYKKTGVTGEYHHHLRKCVKAIEESQEQ